MFETLQPAAPDGILMLMSLYRDDPRTDKLDLGVGVYKDVDGKTPVMRAVREAERRLHKTQASKSYLGLAGDVVFNELMIGLVFGEKAERPRLRAAQTPGGTGALRLLADLIAVSRPDTTVWVPDPTWPNHMPILRAAGLTARTYPYFDSTTGSVRFDAMIEALKGAAPGDVVLLHGCCHNPTGADLSAAQWETVAALLAERGLTPFVDIAYQGFGDGLEKDAAGLRILAAHVPELLAAASCSKNFSVYRDRAGAALLLGRNPAEADTAYGQLLGLARGIWSMPPDHAAACVRIVLEDDDLRADWKAELEAVRLRMLSLREGFAEALRRQSNSDRFDFIARQRGMFSRLGLTGEQVSRLRAEHGVYIVGDSRFNVAGLPGDRLDSLATKVVSVL
jgi:aspartate/tyrosine/aromatic aminotransferase